MRVAGLGVIAARTTQVVEQRGQRSLCRAEQTVKRSDRDLSEQPNCCIARLRRRCTSLEASVEPAGRCLYEQLRDQVLTFLKSWFLGSDLRWSGERALLAGVVRMAKSCLRPVWVRRHQSSPCCLARQGKPCRHDRFGSGGRPEISACMPGGDVRGVRLHELRHTPRPRHCEPIHPFRARSGQPE